MIAAPLRSVPSALSAGQASHARSSVNRSPVSAAAACTSALLASTLLAACAPPTPTPVTEEAAKPATQPASAPVLATKKPSAAVADPAWFSPMIFPGATVTKKGRSPADDQGRFTAQILFSLPTGATLADCTDPIAKAVQGVIPQLDREETGGRITLKGAGPDYEVIAVCGDAKGTMTAFVSYRWTSATASE